MTYNDSIKKAYNVAYTWTDSIGNYSSVTPLSKLAKGKNIKYICFEPLLSTAGIRKNKEGYDIIVNTEATGVGHKEGDKVEASSSILEELSPPLRFSIAHEIAHVIFHEVSNGKFKHLNQKQSEILESNCSKIARILLIPQKKLIQEIGSNLFEATHYKGLYSEFKVSPEVLIRRFELPELHEAFKETNGLLSFVREQDDYLKIIACEIWGPQAWTRFGIGSSSETNKTKPHKPEGRNLNDLKIHPEIEKWLRKDENIKMSLKVTAGKGNWQLPCEFSACRIQKEPLSFFIGIKVTGPPEQQNQF